MKQRRANGLTRYAVILAVSVTFTASSLARDVQRDPAVGVVSEYAPVTARYVCKRDVGSTLVTVPLRIGTVVMAGDEIALPPNGAVTLSVVDGPARRLEGPETFRVPAGAELGVLTRLWRGATSVLDVEYRTAVTAVSRGGTPCAPGVPAAAVAVPILPPNARIVAGVRDIPLAWTGGCAPYSVALLREQAVLTQQDGIARTQVRLDRVRLLDGITYTVAISDARGTRQTFELRAVAVAPAPPSELAASTSTLGTIARALWLADQDGGAWRLNSFEMLRPAIRAGEPLAGRVGDVLLWQSGARMLDGR